MLKVDISIIHFAWDNPKQDLEQDFKDFKKRSKLGYRKLKVYVLTNFDSTMDENLYRVYKLRELGYDPYVMIYDKENSPIEIRRLQRWVNNKRIFRSCETYTEYQTSAQIKIDDSQTNIFEGEIIKGLTQSRF